MRPHLILLNSALKIRRGGPVQPSRPIAIGLSGFTAQTLRSIFQLEFYAKSTDGAAHEEENELLR